MRNPIGVSFFVGVDQAPEDFTTPLCMSYSIHGKCVHNLNKLGRMFEVSKKNIK